MVAARLRTVDVQEMLARALAQRRLHTALEGGDGASHYVACAHRLAQRYERRYRIRRERDERPRVERERRRDPARPTHTRSELDHTSTANTKMLNNSALGLCFM